jgi:ribosome biogenesis GTPase A
MPRSKPFSGKQKKSQLAERREQRHKSEKEPIEVVGADEEGVVPAELLTTSLGKSGKTNRFSTVFAKERDDIVWKRKVAADLPLRLGERGKPLIAKLPAWRDPILDHPKGVLLRRGMTEGDRRVYLTAESRTLEEGAYAAWLEGIYKAYPRECLNHFEHSMEVWSQLWHTLASSDVICVVADVRNPLWHIPHSLCEQVTGELGKPLIIILNKADLVPPQHADAWQAFLERMYPTRTRVVQFSSSGCNVGALASLSQRRKVMREARHSQSQALVTARKAAASGLLRAAGAPDEAVSAVLAHMEEVAAKANTTKRERKGAAFEADELGFGSLRGEAGMRATAVTRVVAAVAAGEAETASDDGGSQSEDVDATDEELGEDDESGERGYAGAGEASVVNAAAPVCAPRVRPGRGGMFAAIQEDTSSEGEALSGAEESGDEVSCPTGTDAAGTDAPASAGTAASKSVALEADSDSERSGGVDAVPAGDAGGAVAIGPVRATRPTAARAHIPTERDPRFAVSDKSARRRARKLKHADRESGRAVKSRSSTDARTAGASGGTAGEAAKTAGMKPGSRERAGAAFAGSAAPALPTLTIGMVGHPNAGKSSVINCIAGEKRVSVSRTAGHTKRAQTVPLCPGLALLDCPGLVFPHALVTAAVPGTDGIAAAAAAGTPSSGCVGGATLASRSPYAAPTFTSALGDEELEQRAVQELLGVIPIAQVREPYTAVRYLAEHVPVERMYGLTIPRGETEWSPLLLCETLAVKRGVFIAKIGRPDAHAAGREVLYDSQDGVLPIAWLPPPFEAVGGTASPALDTRS